MNWGSAFVFCCFWLLVKVDASSRHRLPHDPCDLSFQRRPESLRSDQMTVLINGYSESRIPLLLSIAASYSASPVVAAVLVLWGNLRTPPWLLSELSRNLSAASLGTAQISLVPQSSSSLNARFLPRPLAIETRAVLICDDDVEVDAKSVEFAFRVWGSNPDRIVGMFGRSHDMDLVRKQWIYTVHPDRYSIVLTKFMLLKTQYLFSYSCGSGPVGARMRKVVDEMANCEDILMNFVVADEINAGPVLVGAERVRDYGDARNEGGSSEKRDEVRDAGLSRRRGEHRKRRGHCIREFHKAMGRMPLRYSHGKMVNSVGEQGLCIKGGKLVFCDQFLS
ncbi:glycosyltransferase family protein 64 C3 [Syzygium oleosum]|uniref:glycosyltransferase family protein 64 C3 n=1 Tax=Syzygium oleosum TaxID=219896 RepID=UPI0024B90565|nr:glycosyltransferase family protein 64 C3 [Syzygium oleosum]XP_030473680.2 glycosyltransferase family protein 64 C3 [Syzygium oleosum]XP_030473681.2 glycosyltransferase family protein 64 C3 [Syzygium oleosum]XP_030473682.2 glycosyltransferase family protein 64 C3 [Syzygium oleosum]XP_030473683.2 glycosyltransferase family protein 64 C3 [Syzygium oleosum]XP_030473686.2 glycosyltransferase family protein 64 C3 [Syzygium oleosum]XP_056162199.1 glycosyltransferase family protein 64 C3 [Syzygium